MAEGGLLAYVGKAPEGGYMFIVPAGETQKHVEPPRLAKLVVTPAEAQGLAGHEADT